MGESYIYADFPAGVITDRFVQALSVLPATTLAKLIVEKKIRTTPYDKVAIPYGLTHYNLQWLYMDDYAQACGLPLRHFLFGSQIPQNLTFSNFDDALLPMLHQIPAEWLVVAEETMQDTFHNPLFDIPDKITPSAKLINLFLMGARFPIDVPDSELYRFTIDINNELRRFRDIRLKERAKFHIDNICELSMYARVSPHWVFSLSGELLCDTPEADAFFDSFCLLSREQQIAALRMLLDICRKQDIPLLPETVSCAEAVMEREGGISHWN